MKKIMIVLLFVLLLTSCSKTDEELMGEVFERMVFDMSGTIVIESDFCSEYSEYFDENNEDYIQCEGDDGFYYFLEHLLLEGYVSINDVSVYIDSEEDRFIFFVIQEYEKIVLGSSTKEEPFIISEQGIERYFF